MAWLSANWFWIALAIGGFFLLSRTGCGMGHANHPGHDGSPAAGDGTQTHAPADSGTATPGEDQRQRHRHGC